MATSTDYLTVSVWRQTKDEPGNFQSFSVPRQDSQTVLDVVSWIQQNADASLSYRFACRVGMCGSCAMMVNGEPRWTCRTHVEKVADNGQLTVEPLRNLPVIKDVVVDMDPFFDKWVAAEAKHHPSQFRTDPIERIDPQDNRRQIASQGIECINCAICYSACDTVASSGDYLGPAALQRSWTLINDEKDAGYQAVLSAVSGTGGCHNCHSMGNCTHYCPNDLNPMQAIAGLKRETVKNFWPRKEADA